MKSFKQYINESIGKTSIEILGWPDAQKFNGTVMKFTEKIKIAKQHAKVLGVGSTRVVFEIDFKNKPTVIKIAKNERGLRQNLAEANFYNKYKSKPPYAPPMIDWDDNDDADTSWIHIMKAAKFNEQVFFSYFKITFKEFSSILSNYINKVKVDINPQVRDFISFVEGNDLMLGEYRQKSNWGIWNMKPVIIDAGITKTNKEIAW